MQGHEIDCLFEQSFDALVPIEIKSGMTFQDSFYKSLNAWKRIAHVENEKGYLVYAGEKNMAYKGNEVFSWDAINRLMEQLQ